MEILGHSLRPKHWFVVKAVSLLILWKIIYAWIISDYTSIDYRLTKLVANSSSYLFQWFGHESQFTGTCITIDGVPSVCITNPCNGLELYPLFVAFIFITPGRILHKILYSLLGVAIIFLTNTIRVYLLGINFVNNPSTFEFNHKYTYLWFVYLFIFILWIVWIEVINKKNFGKAFK